MTLLRFRAVFTDARVVQETRRRARSELLARASSPGPLLVAQAPNRAHNRFGVAQCLR